MSSYSKQAQRAHKLLNTFGIPLEIEGVQLGLCTRITMLMEASWAAGAAGEDINDDAE